MWSRSACRVWGNRNKRSSLTRRAVRGMGNAVFAKCHRGGWVSHAAIVSLAIATMFAPSAAAQSYPNKPVKLEVGAPAGGGTDIVARMLGDKLGESMKQSFVVDNRPGASNTIAADFT